MRKNLLTLAVLIFPVLATLLPAELAGQEQQAPPLAVPEPQRPRGASSTSSDSDGTRFLGSAGYRRTRENPGGPAKSRPVKSKQPGLYLKSLESGGEAMVVTNELLVAFKSNVSVVQEREFLARHELRPIYSRRRRLSKLGILRLRAPAPETVERLLEIKKKIQEEKGVDFVELNRWLPAGDVGELAVEIWDDLTRSRGVAPARLVLGHLGEGLSDPSGDRIVSPYNFVDDTRDVSATWRADAPVSHALSDPFLPDASCSNCFLMPIKVVQDGGSTLADLSEAMVYAVDYDAQVVLLPIASGATGSAALSRAKRYVLDSGVGLREPTFPETADTDRAERVSQQQGIEQLLPRNRLPTLGSGRSRAGTGPSGEYALRNRRALSRIISTQYKGHRFGIEELTESGKTYVNEEFGFELEIDREVLGVQRADFYEQSVGYSQDYPLLFGGFLRLDTPRETWTLQIKLFERRGDRSLSDFARGLQDVLDERMPSLQGRSALHFEEGSFLGRPASVLLRTRPGGKTAHYWYIESNGLVYSFTSHFDKGEAHASKLLETFHKILDGFHLFVPLHDFAQADVAPDKSTVIDYAIPKAVEKRISAYAELPQTISVAVTDDTYIDHSMWDDPCETWNEAGRPYQQILESVNFKNYVTESLVGEWSTLAIPDVHQEALNAGALAVRSHALFRAVNKGGEWVWDSQGTARLVDVVDNVCNQVYKPHLPNGEDRGHSEAVDLTWDSSPIVLKRIDYKNIFEFYHCAGRNGGQCIDPGMEQLATQEEAESGLSWKRILYGHYAPAALYTQRPIAESDRVRSISECITIRHDGGGVPQKKKFQCVTEDRTPQQCDEQVPCTNLTVPYLPLLTGGTVIDVFDGLTLGGNEIWFKIQWDNGVAGWSFGQFLIPEGSGVLFLPDLKIGPVRVTKTGRTAAGDMHTYEIRATVENVGVTLAYGASICFEASVGTMSGCLAQEPVAAPPLPLAPGASREIPFSFDLDYDLNELLDNPTGFGTLVVRPESIHPQSEPPDPTIGDSKVLTIDDHYIPVCVAPTSRRGRGSRCHTGPDLTYSELGGLRIDQDNSIEFLMKSLEAGPGDPIVSYEDARDEFVRIFLQALSVPNYKHWIDLQVTGPETGYANLPPPFQDTDMADAFLYADVEMKFELYGNSEHRNSLEIWSNLVHQSPYWGELQSVDFEEYPNWVIAATLIPGDTITAYQTDYSIFFEDALIDIDAGWWWVEPWIDLSGYSLSAGAVADLNQRVLTFRDTIQNAVRSYSEDILVPAINSADASPEFRRLKAMYSTIAVAQWYKLQVASNPDLPYAHLVDAEDLDGIRISPPFDQNFWNDQANQTLWEGECDLLYGPAICLIFGGAEMQNSRPDILGGMTSLQEQIVTRVLDDFEAVQDGDFLYHYGSTILGHGPELLVPELKLPGGEKLITGETATVSVTVANVGTEATAPFDVHLIARYPDDTTVVVATESVSLASVSSVDILFQWTAPGVPGLYTLQSLADAGDVVSEGDEGNNLTERLVEVASPYPVVDIFVPADGSVFSTSHRLQLSGEAADPEEGPLGGTQLSWASSISGHLGFGEVVTGLLLPEGQHVISLTASDSQGLLSTEQVTITISDTALEHRLTVELAGSGLGSVVSGPSGIVCGSDCAMAFAQGTEVTLTAEAWPESGFVGWAGAGCSGVGNCQLTLDSDVIVTATFDHDSPSDAVELTASSSPFGYVPLSSFGLAPFGCPDVACDDSGWVVGGLDFQWLGQQVDSAVWSTNGYIYLAASDSMSPLNQEFPDPVDPNFVLAPFWTDLDLDGGDGIGGGSWYFADLTDGSSTWHVFEWADVQEWGQAGSAFTFQIWIESGTSNIWFVYEEIVPGVPETLTVGAEDAGGNEGNAYYYDGSGVSPKVGVDLKVWSPLHCTVGVTVEVSHRTIATTESHEACGTITAGPELSLVSPADVVLSAGLEVRLQDMSVEEGATLGIRTAAGGHSRSDLTLSSSALDPWERIVGSVQAGISYPKAVDEGFGPMR